jgi:hypothetical protein
MRIRSILLVSALSSLSVLAVACGNKSGPERLAEAQAALQSAKPDSAVAAAEQGLASAEAKADPALAWRLEQARLDGLAGAKKGAQVATDLERLSATYPKQVTAALYRALADKLVQAGDTGGAIDVLSAGDKKFPSESASFVEAIDALKAQGNLDPDHVKKLESLGYL